MGAFGSDLVVGAIDCLLGATSFWSTFLGCAVLVTVGFFDRVTNGFVGDPGIVFGVLVFRVFVFGEIVFIAGGASCGAAVAGDLMTPGTGTDIGRMLGDGIPEGRDRCTCNR